MLLNILYDENACSWQVCSLLDSATAQVELSPAQCGPAGLHPTPLLVHHLLGHDL